LKTLPQLLSTIRVIEGVAASASSSVADLDALSTLFLPEDWVFACPTKLADVDFTPSAIALSSLIPSGACIFLQQLVEAQ